MQKVNVIEYSEKSIAVRVEPDTTEQMILEAGGMFAPILKRNGSYQAGYIFSKAKHSEVAKEVATKVNYELVDYSEKSVAIFGELSQMQLEMIKLKGLYNRGLTDSTGARFAGWIFAKSKSEKVIGTLKDVTKS
jgi:hypothetical protein